MREREKFLTPNQKEALRFLASVVGKTESPLVINKKSLGEAFGLSPEETTQVCAV